MKIPRFWAKGAAGMEVCNPGTGAPMSFSCWGWSTTSQNEAEAMAEERTKRVVEMIRAGRKPDSYLYSDKPLREEIIEEWKRPDGSIGVVITRNSMGCLVMNTTTIMFVDVDIPDSESPGLFSQFFGKKKEDPRKQKEQEAIGKVYNMVKLDSKCGVRIYRTKGGLRYLLTHSHTIPSAEATLGAMQALGADPLYVRLCRVQECFRARLTPKPWRCEDIPVVHLAYPWRDKDAEQAAREWIAEYSKDSEAYATCSLVEHIGNRQMDSEINRAVVYHDRMTKASSGLELA